LAPETGDLYFVSFCFMCQNELLMKKIFLMMLVLFSYSLSAAAAVESVCESSFQQRPIESLLGETLTYNISFLWFDKIARGEIKLEKGEVKDTYVATLTAKTYGMAAFFTSHRIEIYTTLMEKGPNGLLRPLLQTSNTQKEKRGKISQRQTSYDFDFAAKNVTYLKKIDGVEQQKILLGMEGKEPVYDFLTAFYNFRLGYLGDVEVGRDLKLTAFSRKGPEEIVISRLVAAEQNNLKFSNDLLLCRILLLQETFNSKSRDVYVGFDAQLRPQVTVVKNVIGLGDVQGKLIQVVEPNSH
jgi:hypothetical protein